jgi:Tfp pilus assembly protein FimT
MARRIPRYPTKQSAGPLRACAFTLVELLVFTSIVFALSAIGYNSMSSFSEERKLRAASIELSGYLENARTMAQASNAPCVITIKSETGGIFDTSASASTNSCRDPGSIVTTLDLGQFSGANQLRVQVKPGSGTLPYTFTTEGTSRAGITFLVSSSVMKSGSWCVDVQWPLATVRRGWLPAGSSTCNYGIEP